MSSHLRQILRQGIRLPPSGWLLAGMLAFYVLGGLFGRDPWKGEDAVHIGTAWHILQYGDWLTPDLAGRAFYEPPLYYWTAALTGKLLGGLLPLHEAIRLASGLWIALALTGLYYAGRELYGQDSAAASPLILAGCLGLILHAHEAQPMLIALAGYSAGIGSLAALGRRPRLTGLIFGLSVSVVLLGNGLLFTLPLLFAALLAQLLAVDRRRAAETLFVALAGALTLTLPFVLLLQKLEPQHLQLLLASEFADLTTLPSPLRNLGNYGRLLLNFAFPALPLAVWGLWRHRPQWREMRFALPFGTLVATLAILATTQRVGEIPALMLLPPIALLATPGALALRRGAANAFDWFAMSSFSLFAALVWLAWSAMVLGWPTKLAERVTVLRPGFTGQFDLSDCLWGIAASLFWLWLIVTAPRSPYRSLVHWTFGLTTLWMLASSLLLPWFDYGKSYRPVAEAVARALPDDLDCLAERGLTNTQRASLAYFVGLEPQSADTRPGQRCHWVLVTGDTPPELAAPAGRWTRAWEGSRPGERQEKFRLYRRAGSTNPVKP